MHSKRWNGWADSGFRLLLWLFGTTILLLMGLMVYQLVVAAKPSWQAFGLQFLWSRDWDPIQEQFGALPFIFGTIASSLLALVFAVPVSFGVAAFLTEIAPAWIRTPIAFLVELLAAIPSVVYGLWGIFVMVPWLRTTVQPWLQEHFGFLPLFKGPILGVSLLAAGLILAIMIVPTISSVTREVLHAVPHTQREAALAMGATRWETIRLTVFPYARSGIIGGVMLGLGRALGETMAVTMVIGNRPEISASLFSPAYTISSVLANEFAEAVGKLHTAALMEIGLILFAITLLFNMFAQLLVWNMTRRAGGVMRE